MQHGMSVTELLCVVAIVAVSAAVAAPLVHQSVVRHESAAAATRIESLVQRARMNAVKQKVAHRLLIHDQAAATPNTLELQRAEGGSFTTLPQGTYAFPASVRIPTGGPSSVTVSARGVCSAVSLSLESQGHGLRTVSVGGTCLTQRL